MMLDSKKALISGSFDPPTMGHYDLALRASKMFDEVYVTEFVNSSKHGFFGTDERLEMLRAAFADIPNIHVDVWGGLLVDYAREHGIGTIVKGARSATDFDYEQSLALINRSLEPELDTVILPTKAEYMHISSTMVRELIRYGCDYSAAVPHGVAELIGKYYRHD